MNRREERTKVDELVALEMSCFFFRFFSSCSLVLCARLVIFG